MHKPDECFSTLDQHYIMTQPPRKIGGLYGGIQFSSSSVAPQSSFEPLPQEKEKPTETSVTRLITEVTTSENTPAGPEATTSKPTAGINIYCPQPFQTLY